MDRPNAVVIDDDDDDGIDKILGGTQIVVPIEAAKRIKSISVVVAFLMEEMTVDLKTTK